MTTDNQLRREAHKALDTYGSAPDPFNDSYPTVLDYVRTLALLSLADNVAEIRAILLKAQSKS